MTTAVSSRDGRKIHVEMLLQSQRHQRGRGRTDSSTTITEKADTATAQQFAIKTISLLGT